MNKEFVTFLIILILFLDSQFAMTLKTFQTDSFNSSLGVNYTRQVRIHTFVARYKKTSGKKRVPKKAMDCICGKKASKVRKIVGGNISKEHDHPWIAALVYAKTSKPSQFCGGSLINDRYILTAGHCVYKSVDKDLKSYMVFIGSNQIDGKDALRYSIASVTIHPKYNPGTLDNDIALIKLSKPVTMSTTVRPICLAQTGQTYAGKVSNVAGWGTRGKGTTTVNQLRDTAVKVLGNGDCAKSYGSQSSVKITANMLCATLPGKDSCSGDSGGPLSFKDTDNSFRQIGIVSFGIDCANPKFPGVYTRVSRFIKWIKANTNDGQYCSKSF